MLLKFVAVFFLIFSAGFAQILSKSRPQPILSVFATSQCCGSIDSPTLLATCINSTLPTRSNGVALVTYAESGAGRFGIDDIMNFAAYMLSVTAAYAEHHKYSLRWMSSATGSNYQPEDMRWNKIRILIDALDQQHGWAKDVKYIVWLDADAIVLDLGLDIEAVAAQHPKAELIASADIRMGYINSGVMIMRNSEWMRSFLSQWWNIADRDIICDQDAFDMLYKQYNTRHGQEYMKEKIAILSRDALNSDPPAVTNQLEHNQVMHLMGEITAMRRKVFYTGFNNICRSMREQKPPPQQLGLSREYLHQVAMEVYSEHVQRLLEVARRKESDIEDFNRLSIAMHHLSDLYSNHPSERNMAATRAMFKEGFISILQKLQQFQELKEQPADYLYYLKRAAENGNDMFQSLDDIKLKEKVADQVFKILSQLRKGLADSSKPVADHMTALLSHSMADMYFAQSHQVSATDKKALLKQAMEYEAKAIELFATHFETTDNTSIGREYITSLYLMAIMKCSLQDFSNGLHYWNLAISKSDYFVRDIPMGPIFESFGTLLFNAGVCAYEARQDSLANQYLERSMQVLAHLGAPSDAHEVVHGRRLLAQLTKAIPQTSMENKETVIVTNIDEWEECEDGDPECEDVLVPIDHNRMEQDNFDGDDDDDEDLAEIRAQYAEQSKRFNSEVVQVIEEEEDTRESDEDEEDLAEIREQYARQSQRFEVAP